MPHDVLGRARDFRDTLLDARAQAADLMVGVVHRAAVGGFVIEEERDLAEIRVPIDVRSFTEVCAADHAALAVLVAAYHSHRQAIDQILADAL